MELSHSKTTSRSIFSSNIYFGKNSSKINDHIFEWGSWKEKSRFLLCLQVLDDYQLYFRWQLSLDFVACLRKFIHFLD